MTEATDGATPDDLIPAYKAARIACCTARNLARWSDEGRLRAFKREGYSARFYSRSEVERFRPKPVGVQPKP